MPEVQFTCDCGERHCTTTERQELDERFTCSCGRIVLISASVVSLPGEFDLSPELRQE